jgi:hypothetical protein
VAAFYAAVMTALQRLGVTVKIWPVAVEVPNPIRLDTDESNHSYDPDAAQACWRVLLAIDPVFEAFRSEFIGKASPVHFFWGSFDLAATRFSGRRAPERPGADSIMREGYSHEVISHGFWPGGAAISMHTLRPSRPGSRTPRPVRPRPTTTASFRNSSCRTRPCERLRRQQPISGHS